MFANLGQWHWRQIIRRCRNYLYTGVADSEDFHEFSGAKENLQAKLSKKLSLEPIYRINRLQFPQTDVLIATY